MNIKNSLIQMSGGLNERLDALRGALASLPRCSLGSFPTSLDATPRVTQALGGPRIWVKRDDCSGLAFGGNKTRQLEYVLGNALDKGVNVVIQGAASQSNHSRQLAAAAAKLGIKCILMPRLDARSQGMQGNQLVARLFGAEIHPVANEASMAQAKEEMAQSQRSQGLTPYVVGMGAEEALAYAAVAYVGALVEIVDALQERGELPPTHIYTTSQGSTQAGLLAGVCLLGLDAKVVGINPMDETNQAYVSRQGIEQQCLAAANILGFELTLADGDVINRTEFVAPGYGLASERGRASAALFAQAEGMLFDPVYSGKGLSGMVTDIQSGKLKPQDRVVFLHTGGLPALFSYSEEMLVQSAMTPEL